MNTRMVITWIWTILVVLMMALLVSAISTTEHVDDSFTVSSIQNASYEVISSDAILTSGEWFAIRSDGEFIPAETDGGYHLKVALGQRWKMASEGYLQVSSPTMEYVRVLSHAGFGELVSISLFVILIGVIVWIVGGMFLKIFP